MRAVLAAGVIAGLALAACARPTRDDLYVVLPDREGKAGTVAVGHAGQQHVLDRPYASARIKEPGRVETGTSSEQEVKQVFGAALAAQPPRPVSFVLHFLEGRDELTPESQQLMEQVLAELARRPSPEIVVTGHTDSVGTVTFNDALSLRRAERVRAEIVRRGIPADRIAVAGRGEREPLIPTEDEVAEPRNRRVEITVR
jgi:outer membrane protein OmpA-like peptidoglycan-associated protein